MRVSLSLQSCIKPLSYCQRRSELTRTTICTNVINAIPHPPLPIPNRRRRIRKPIKEELAWAVGFLGEVDYITFGQS